MPILAVWVSMLATLFGPADDAECFALGGLDVARAQALAASNATALSSVYASRATSGDDRRVFELFAARGYRLVGAGMIRNSCRAIDRAPGRVTLDVSERLAPTWAVSESGNVRRLPRSGLERHRVVLAQVGGRWRIASIS